MADVYLGLSSPLSSDGGELRDGSAVALRVGASGDAHAYAATEERLSGRRYDPHVCRSVWRVLERVGAAPNDSLHVAFSSALGPMFTTDQAATVIHWATALQPASVKVVPHHDAHALEAFATSPFKDALVIVADSLGNLRTRQDGSTYWENQTIYRTGRRPDGGCSLEVIARDFTGQFGYGQLFRSVTRYVGFPGYHHAAKVMALAGIGRNRAVRLPVPHIWTADRTPRLKWNLNADDPIGSLRAWLDAQGFDDGGPRDPVWYEHGSEHVNGRSSLRATDIELSTWVQRGWEEHLLERARTLVEQTGVTNICLSGGVALNCVANARLLEQPWVTGVHVGCAPGDHGQALGNLFALLSERAPEFVHTLVPPYFCTDDGVPAAYRADGIQPAAALIIGGGVVAVCRGAAEYGPRALGHRSLLCRPTVEATERLRSIKRREDYQPFAACVTQEYADRYLRGLVSPFMSFAPRISGQAATDLAHIIHDDATCRIQTVTQHGDPWLHGLLKAIELQGLPPALVNTSLNLRSEPMVDEVLSPVELVERFLVDAAVVVPAGASNELG